MNKLTTAARRYQRDSSAYSPTTRQVLLVALLAPLWCLLSANHLCADATFTALGHFGGGQASDSVATDVSADGSVVVGTVFDKATLGLRAFRWTALESVNRTTGLMSGSVHISADGSIVVGAFFSGGIRAFRWPKGGEFISLGVDGFGSGASTGASAASMDGQVIVGTGSSIVPIQHSEGFRWSSQDGMVKIGGDGGDSFATGVSADGSIIVGYVHDEMSHREAFRGTVAGRLGRLPGALESVANGVSADGSVVVGVNEFSSEPTSSLNFRTEAFRWSQISGMVGLGDFPGGRPVSIAYDASADGSVIVGAGETAFDGTNGTSEAFYWTAGTGMLNLRDVLVAGGATGLDGWTLIEARGVSWDGQTVVGTGVHDGVTEAFVATIPEPSSLVLAALATSMCLIIRLRGAKSRLADGRQSADLLPNQAPRLEVSNRMLAHAG